MVHGSQKAAHRSLWMQGASGAHWEMRNGSSRCRSAMFMIRFMFWTGWTSLVFTSQKFNSSPLKSYRDPIRKDRLPLPPFFRSMLNLGGVTMFFWGKSIPTLGDTRGEGHAPHRLTSNGRAGGMGALQLPDKWDEGYIYLHEHHK